MKKRQNKVWLAMITLFSIICVLSCKSDDDDVILPPKISSFTPALAKVGEEVTITGSGFSTIATNNKVNFNGVAATVSKATATSLSVTVPQGATTGKIAVKVGELEVTTATDFTVVLPPTATSFSPKEGIIGTEVVITGTNFSTTAADNEVKFNGIAATVSAATSNSLTVTVPAGATTGKIVIKVDGQEVMSATDFTVIFPPTISSFSPEVGAKDTEVIITGTNFSTTAADNEVKFNETIATISAATATSLTVNVPAGATTGKISVEVNGQIGVSSTNFGVEQVVTTQDFIMTIDENPTANQNLGTVSATTTDGAIAYALSSQTPSGALAIDASTGVLTVTDANLFDYERNTTVTATYTASVGQSTSQSTITINLNDLKVDQTGLIAEYKLDGNLQDATTNGNHGTEKGTLTSVTDRHGITNGAYQFRVNDFLQGYFTIPNILPGSNLSFTISMWVKRDRASFGLLIDKSNGSFPAYNWYVAGAGSSENSLRAYYQESLASPGTFPAVVTNTGVNVTPINEWVHLVLTIQNGSTIKIYVNGESKEIGSSNSVATINTLSQEIIAIGSQDEGFTNTLEGSMDDILFYNRTLTDSEIAALAADKF
ncbi:IPT/TIG domain-containing protein [Aquimarina spinulae]|uniref:IPT/TIG domain-containing protein n=1 Tax=Aquimarina spinulae TaxID=1192023 RepID=UPI000D55E7DF|nr:IPT/TIG domain-containing protein [Aquimarina spinulae]